MSQLKKWFVYLAFIISTMVFLIYYLFPSEFVKRYIIFKVNQINPDLEVSIGKVFPTFPPGLRLDTVSFDYTGNRMFKAEEMRLVPRLASLLRTRRILFFNLNAHSGSAIGTAYLFATNQPGQFDLEAKISGMQLADLPAIQNQTAIKLSGVLGMEISYQTRPETGHTMRARIEILDIALQSENLILNQELLTFERIEADVFMRDGRIGLESCNFRGDQFDATLSGFGVLKNPINKSTIELSGRLSPHSLVLTQQDGSLPSAILNALKSESDDLTISIRGLIENPSFSFE